MVAVQKNWKVGRNSVFDTSSSLTCTCECTKHHQTTKRLLVSGSDENQAEIMSSPMQLSCTDVALLWLMAQHVACWLTSCSQQFCHGHVHKDVSERPCGLKQWLKRLVAEIRFSVWTGIYTCSDEGWNIMSPRADCHLLFPIPLSIHIPTCLFTRDPSLGIWYIESIWWLNLFKKDLSHQVLNSKPGSMLGLRCHGWMKRSIKCWIRVDWIPSKKME